jgi:hypothetical protein
MLSKSIESRHLDRFRQALYYLETFDIQGRKWEIDKYNIVRVANATGSIDKETSWGKLGYIDDWFLELVEFKKGAWSTSLSTLKSNYKRRRKPFTRLYSIGHRRGERARARPGGPTLPKRRKITSINPWTGYIVSYLEDRRIKRSLEGEKSERIDLAFDSYEPTTLDVERILLAAAPFVQTFARQIEEFCSDAPPNQRL